MQAAGPSARCCGKYRHGRCFHVGGKVRERKRLRFFLLLLILRTFFLKKKRSFNRGWLEGNEHGKLHGLFEGRQLGTEKGFELWMELGTMEGVATTWLRRLQSATTRKSQKQVQQLLTLLNAISEVPTVNDDKIDLGAEMERIRARYKSVCFSLNIRDVREDENTDGQVATIKGRRVNTANLHF